MTFEPAKKLASDLNMPIENQQHSYRYLPQLPSLPLSTLPLSLNKYAQLPQYLQTHSHRIEEEHETSSALVPISASASASASVPANDSGAHPHKQIASLQP
jgi:hypothetical protein